MATTVTTIDKGDLILWVVRDLEGDYTIWDVGTAQETCCSTKGWTLIKFKRLGITNWEVKSIVMVPIAKLNFYDNATDALKKNLQKQQGESCWCIRFKEMD